MSYRHIHGLSGVLASGLEASPDGPPNWLTHLCRTLALATMWLELTPTNPKQVISLTKLRPQPFFLLGRFLITHSLTTQQFLISIKCVYSSNSLLKVCKARPSPIKKIKTINQVTDAFPRVTNQKSGQKRPEQGEIYLTNLMQQFLLLSCLFLLRTFQFGLRLRLAIKFRVGPNLSGTSTRVDVSEN